MFKAFTVTWNDIPETCPWCGFNLIGVAWEAWNMTGKKEFEIICPCGTKILVKMEIEGAENV